MKPECSNCQIMGGLHEIGRDDLSCAIKDVATETGVRAPEYNRDFFCNCYWPYGKKGIESFEPDTYLNELFSAATELYHAINMCALPDTTNLTMLMSTGWWLRMKDIMETGVEDEH